MAPWGDATGMNFVALRIAFLGVRLAAVATSGWVVVVVGDLW